MPDRDKYKSQINTIKFIIDKNIQGGLLKAISVASLATMVPILVVYQYALDIYGIHDVYVEHELLNGIEVIKKFYGYT